MTARWHGVPCDCPKCNKKMTILSVSICQSGDLKVEGCCINCGVPLQITLNCIRLIVSATKCDMEEEMERLAGRQVIPVGFDETDLEFLNKIKPSGVN